MPMRPIVTITAILLAGSVGALLYAVIELQRKLPQAPVAAPAPLERLIYSEGGHDLWVEDLERMRLRYRIGDKGEAALGPKRFEAGKPRAYQVFEAREEGEIEGRLIVFETEFGTSYVTERDVRNFAEMLSRLNGGEGR